MSIFSKVGIFWLLFLVMYCTVLVAIVLFACQFGVSIIFYFNDGEFFFSWKKALHISLIKGGVTGLILGVGVWLKNKVHEYRWKKSRRG
ncbi:MULTISPECIES: hypothetical protein [Enterobacter]|uniref:hypothetical protein n=1 Tax=Enterobacter TaxID=547 RepID=UPI0018C27CC5|nr:MULTISPECIES: hypothetical protein [Enterobacter]MBG0626211.1 hypothetical protein [Enterobacter roggenkampii]MCB5949715.1 hypothetical protein [Enterobacter sp. TCD1-1]MCM7169504.1 hypothetical protein [Enterobacter quasiroggenkampii]MCU6325060.1 hypothetical protein [Enterobacter quasiroggenkampii]